MKTTYHTEEEIKNNVHAENQLRKIHNLVSNKIRAILRPYIGQKIVKQSDQALIKALKDQADKILGEARQADITPLIAGHWAKCHYISLQPTYSILWVRISLSFNGGSYDDPSKGKPYTLYYDDSYYMGDTDHKTGVLEKVSADCTLSSVKATEQIKAYKKVKALFDKGEATNGELLPKNKLF